MTSLFFPRNFQLRRASHSCPRAHSNQPETYNKDKENRLLPINGRAHKTLLVDKQAEKTRFRLQTLANRSNTIDVVKSRVDQLNPAADSSEGAPSTKARFFIERKRRPLQIQGYPKQLSLELKPELEPQPACNYVNVANNRRFRKNVSSKPTTQQAYSGGRRRPPGKFETMYLNELYPFKGWEYHDDSFIELIN